MGEGAAAAGKPQHDHGTHRQQSGFGRSASGVSRGHCWSATSTGRSHVSITLQAHPCIVSVGSAQACSCSSFSVYNTRVRVVAGSRCSLAARHAPRVHATPCAGFGGGGAVVCRGERAHLLGDVREDERQRCRGARGGFLTAGVRCDGEDAYRCMAALATSGGRV